MDRGAWRAAVHGIAEGWTRLSDFTFTFHFHALEKEMATHSSVLAWGIPGTGEPGGLPSMGSHRVGRDWSDLGAAGLYYDLLCTMFHFLYFIFSVPISFSSCSPISPSLLFFDVLSQAFIKCSRKAFVYMFIYIICITYILENLWIFA